MTNAIEDPQSLLNNPLSKKQIEDVCRTFSITEEEYKEFLEMGNKIGKIAHLSQPDPVWESLEISDEDLCQMVASGIMGLSIMHNYNASYISFLMSMAAETLIHRAEEGKSNV